MREEINLGTTHTKWKKHTQVYVFLLTCSLNLQQVEGIIPCFWRRKLRFPDDSFIPGSQGRREARRAKLHLPDFFFTHQRPCSLPAHRSQCRVQIDFFLIKQINELIQNCYNTRQITICILTEARGIIGMPRNKVNCQRTQRMYPLRG